MGRHPIGPQSICPHRQNWHPRILRKKTIRSADTVYRYGKCIGENDMPSATSPTISRVSWSVKQVISDKTGRPAKDVRHAHSLKDEYGFTSAGKMDLAPRLNTKFAGQGFPISPPLHPTETAKAKTVGDLVLLIRGRFAGGGK